MKVFVTGGTGFVGANLVRALLSNGYEVRALIRSGSNLKNLQDLPIERVTGDLSNKKTLIEAMFGCEALAHVAAHYSLWRADGPSLYRANVEGTRKVESQNSNPSFPEAEQEVACSIPIRGFLGSARNLQCLPNQTQVQENHNLSTEGAEARYEPDPSIGSG